MTTTTQTQPTVAPWLLCPSTIAGRPSGRTHIEGPNGESIGIVNTHWPEGEANGRLMVKAPEMQQALDAIAAMKVDETTDHAQLSALCIAIARAAIAPEAK